MKLSKDIINTYNGKKILISGGRGYIGSSLTEALLDIDCELTLLDKSDESAWMPEKRIAKVSMLKRDITLKETWESALPGVDYVFHLAAIEYDRVAYDIELDFLINTWSVLEMLEVCREKELRPRIIFASSANIFGFDDQMPVNEKHRDNPPSLWSANKLMAENYLRIYAQQYGIESVCLRLVNIYGPAERRDTMSRVVVNKIIGKALSGDAIYLYGNKDCIRDYIFLDDVISAFVYAGARDNIRNDGSYYIIGSGEKKTIAEVWQIIADKVKDQTGKGISIKVDSSVKLEPLDMRDFVADTSLFKNLTGWRPNYFLDRGIEITVKKMK